MSRTEPELWSMLREADGMSHGEAQQAIMEDVVRHADAGGFHRLAFTARRALASAYSVDRQWHKAFPLFSRCLSEYDQRPWQFGPEEEWSLRQWYTNIVQSMAEFPEIGLDQMYAAFSDMEKRFTTGGHSLRDVHAARRWVAQLAGDWAEEERCYQAWIAAGGPDPNSVWDFEPEIERLVLRGDDASLARARELAAPVLDGQRTFGSPPVPIQCLMLLPLACAGEDRQATRAYQRASRTMLHSVYRFEYSGMLIEFCALTGNAEEGLRELKRYVQSFDGLNRPNGKMEFAASAAVLMRVMIDDGRGAEEVERGFGSGDMTTVARLHGEFDGVARDLAARFDARNGSTAQGDRVRARLEARPVRDFLPLTPTARRPRPPMFAPGTPPEQVLDRAEWHLRAGEETVAKRALKALADPVPARLAGRAVEARALAAQGDDCGAELSRAAEEHLRTGERRRYLLCRIQLGKWLAEHGRAAEGVPMASAAVREIGAAADTWALAWGEMLLSQTVRKGARPDLPGSFAAITRAGQAAAAAGDPLVVGRVALEHGWHREKAKADPAEAIQANLAARDALLAAGADRLARASFMALRANHRRAGTEPAYLAMVAGLLPVLPATTHPNVRAFLQREHGEALIGAGRPAEAIPVLGEALGELDKDDLDRAPDWYGLAVACLRTERYEDAVHAATTCVQWLYNLRAKDGLDRPEMADECRMLLATAYHRLGEAKAAAEQYTKAIETAHETGHRSQLPSALTGLAELRSEQGEYAAAAARFAEAGQAYAAQGDPYLAAQMRCSEAIVWCRADDTDRAEATFTAAEQAVRSLPQDPRANRCWAELGRAGVLVMVAQGRGPDAVRYATQSATAFRQAGIPAAATEMDVAHARILLSDGRPDLARQLADSLAQQGIPDAAEAVRGVLAS